MRAYQNIELYQPQWCLSTWLFTIAYRLAISHYRKTRPLLGAVDLDQVQCEQVQPHEKMEAAEQKDRLWRIARGMLTPTQFTVLWLYYVEQMPFKHIGKVTRRLSASTRALMFLVRSKLRPHLESSQQIPDEPLFSGAPPKGCLLTASNCNRKRSAMPPNRYDLSAASGDQLQE